MKKYHLILSLLLISLSAVAQIPSNYYDTATGSGYTLKTQLNTIITNGHSDQGYGSLYTGYQTTHTDNYYENDGSVLDFYSENPTGTDAYFYTHGNNNCGNYNSENDCYNREHLMPQSVYSSASPMRNDIHHVIPSDGYVNNRRGSFAFGEVSSPSWTSTNGSKVGPNTFGSYNGTVFEPIDEFKGDIARAMLYFATRYENQVASWSHAGMLNGTSNQVYQDWFLDLLISWHTNDPVNQQEIDRNNAAYNYQGNANPFINHPEWVNVIWNPNTDTEDPSVPMSLSVSNETSSTIGLDWSISTDNVGVTEYDIYVDGTYNTSSATNSHTVTGLSASTTYSFTVLAKDAENNMSAQSSAVNGTTIAGGSGGSTCVTETFTNIPSGQASYATRTWTGDTSGTGMWEATDARTDQSLNGNAITVRDGILTSPSFTDGIGQLTVTTQRIFGGGSGTFDLLVNDISVGSIPFSDTEETTTVLDIDIPNNVIIKLDKSGNTDRVSIDDLIWTCYSTLSVDSYNLSEIKLYPNPTKGTILNIDTPQNLAITIFDLLGKKLIVDSVSNSKKYIDISKLKPGAYFIKLSSKDGTTTRKFIKR